jgi:predicted ATPase
MAKLTVRNVGPIREAELDVKKHTVFIGPQGTGKSTLAKLIAISGDHGFLRDRKIGAEIFRHYNMQSYIDSSSFFSFFSTDYSILFESSLFNIHTVDDPSKPVLSEGTIESLRRDINKGNFDTNRLIEEVFSAMVADKILLSDLSSYIPAERNLLSTLNSSIWSLISSNIDFPDSILFFAKNFEKARNEINYIDIPFMNIRYFNKEGNDTVSFNNGFSINLSQSASGYQSMIPLVLLMEHQRTKSFYRFIIEEPELNLYPTTQKELIYSLIGGLQPNIDYKNAEWVITTHSPYVLSSFNTLMLAYKVGNQSDELRAEVEKIIPSRCWVNPDEFAAYYVDNGTVRSIINPQTGLIADNELDDVSEELADEQDKLLALRRSVTRA